MTNNYKCKICTKCRIEKELSEFAKDKYSKTGYTSACKKCRTVQAQRWLKRNNIENPWYNSYRGAKERCTNINHIQYKNYGGRRIKFLMTIEEVKILWFRDKAYLMKKPSIDRKENNGNYEFDNCQFIELKINVRKDSIIPIIQLNLKNEIIKYWESQQDARKYYGDSVKECLRNRCKTAYGFKWEYTNV